MSRICVAHLIRRGNGSECLARFLRSYRQCSAGIDHDLVFLMKGYADGHLEPGIESEIRGLRHECLWIPDQGYDVESYWTLVRENSSDYYCFLNSFSEILTPEWLAKIHANITRDGIGVAGATGSWESLYQDLLDAANQSARHGNVPGLTRPRDTFNWLRLVVKSNLRRKHYRPFPNPHLRSNAFMISSATARQLNVGSIRSKENAWRLESGHRGLTGQIEEMGKRAVIVGKDGSAFEWEQWPVSKTFWQGQQENLMVADNQTRRYQDATSQQQAELTRRAWGSAGK